MPETAQRHFERALRLAARSGTSAADRGRHRRVEASQIRPVRRRKIWRGSPAADEVDRTRRHQPGGRLLLPALAQTSSFRLVESDPPREDEVDKLLPATTAECVEEAHGRSTIIGSRAEILLEKATLIRSTSRRCGRLDRPRAGCYAAGVVAQVQTAFLKALSTAEGLASHFNVALGCT